ncbi:MAG: PH domain-containing protein [Firmicutes bacterium]|nr:PH domain-containing protein [Bacillota bacterium]
MDQQLTTDIFNQMLNNGETIVRVFKPDKSRFWASRLIGHLPLLIFFLPFGAFMLIPALIEGITALLYAAIAVMVGIVVLFFLIEILTGRAWYRNRWYCYTNQRIIVQCGVFGRNYRFVQLNQLMNSNVRVSLLDRKHNTGTVWFSTMGGMMGMHSMNMAMMSGSRHSGMGMGFATSVMFMYVKNPHNIMREIQEAAAAQTNNMNHMNNQNLANQIGGVINQNNQQQWNNNPNQGQWNNNPNQGQQGWDNNQNQQNWGNPNDPNNNNNNGGW